MIVEALDFNNETSGKYFSWSGVSILPSVHFFSFLFSSFSPLSQQCLGGVSLKVREGGLFFLNPPCPLPHGPLGGFVCACALKCVDRWLQGGDELKEEDGSGEGCQGRRRVPPPPFFF